MEKHEQLDDWIKASLQTDAQPSIYLNQALKTKIRGHESKAVSLWYLPLVASIILIICFNMLAQVFISSVVGLIAFATASGYFCLSIIIFTLISVKWFNFTKITAVNF